MTKQAAQLCIIGAASIDIKARADQPIQIGTSIPGDICPSAWAA